MVDMYSIVYSDSVVVFNSGSVELSSCSIFDWSLIMLCLHWE